MTDDFNRFWDEMAERRIADLKASAELTRALMRQIDELENGQADLEFGEMLFASMRLEGYGGL